MRRAACVAGVAAVVLTALAPALAMALDSLRGPHGFTLAAYTGVLAERRQWTLLVRSTAVSSGATALALVWGTAVGWAVARARGWRGMVLETLAYVPLCVPSLVLAMGWVFFFGHAGALTRALGFDGALALYSPAGAAFVLSLAYFPCVAILAAQGFRSIDPAAAQAARLAAGPARRAWRFWRPLLAPYLATGACLTFLLAFADFGVPSALMVNVYPIEVFAQFSAFLDVKGAIASSAPAVLVAFAAFLARALLAAPTPRAMAPATGVPVGRASRLGLALAAGALVLSLGVPLAFLVWTAGSDYAEALRIAGDQVLTSLAVAAGGTGACLLAALAFALAYRGLAPRARALAEGALLLPLVVPASAVGLGILWFVNARVWPFSALYPAPGILAYACFARFVPLPALVVATALASLPAELASAAAVHGASRARTAARIVAPLVHPALAAAATLAFVLCLGELSTAVLVSPPGSMTLAVRLASLLHFGKDSIVAALCVMLTGLVVLVLALGLLLAGAPVRLRLQHADRAP